MKERKGGCGWERLENLSSVVQRSVVLLIAGSRLSSGVEQLPCDGESSVPGGDVEWSHALVIPGVQFDVVAGEQLPDQAHVVPHGGVVQRSHSVAAKEIVFFY